VTEPAGSEKSNFLGTGDAVSLERIGDASMATGQVKWFDNRKGWGFITQSDGQDVFVHYRSIHGEGFRKLKDGQEVEFDVVQGDKGLYAENVRPAGV